jgi:hypothetical protein
MKIEEMKDGESYAIGDIGNYYGGLEIRVLNGVYQWAIENWDGHYWEDISESLAVELLKQDEKVAELEETK